MNDELGITILDFRLVIQKSSFVTLQSYIFMAEHNELGKFGEELAVEFLQQNGYTILETNWSFQKAEIDIIAQIGNTLAVVEVKTRSSIEFGLPQDFIKPKKIQLLVKAVNEYVTKNDLEFSIRFDVIAVYKEENNYNIDHIIDAFYHF